MPSANIILILDKSTSMSIDQYFSSAQTDCSTFVNIMKINDKLGVVTLSTGSQIIFPTSGNQMVAITGLPVQNQAVQAVVGTAMAGSTNMTDAIVVSHSLIASAATPRAIILLSDGEYNTGGNPLTNLPTDVPIYTIALGPSWGCKRFRQLPIGLLGQGWGITTRRMAGTWRLSITLLHHPSRCEILPAIPNHCFTITHSKASR